MEVSFKRGAEGNILGRRGARANNRDSEISLNYSRNFGRYMTITNLFC